VIDEARLGPLLSPFGVTLGAQQAGSLLVYLDLLLHWNQRINLTAVRSPEECVTRHFGESLYLAHRLNLRGRLLDVGSGAGFPGLALKIVAAELAVTLLDPVAKKRAFLKEVARACGFDRVEVRGERLRDFIRRPTSASFDFVTARAVGRLQELARDSARCLAPEGQLCLWLAKGQAEALTRRCLGFTWDRPIDLPLGRERQILIGRLRHSESHD
jgi:16S rRNA (guanine527-N7)-methyltransferase